ncbi:uncharacterized protein LOC118493910 [Sander lucioperca]|uniref:uncharacterized protein LOC118493910 n=1 Tax=Sander lucioperca TaxID=283035 RepID=UPI001653DBBF|nr:uncharacterized protein LOC118493910 [Sander lucioperca]
MTLQLWRCLRCRPSLPCLSFSSSSSSSSCSPLLSPSVTIQLQTAVLPTAHVILPPSGYHCYFISAPGWHVSGSSGRCFGVNFSSFVPPRALTGNFRTLRCALCVRFSGYFFLEAARSRHDGLTRLLLAIHHDSCVNPSASSLAPLSGGGPPPLHPPPREALLLREPERQGVHFFCHIGIVWVNAPSKAIDILQMNEEGRN